MLVLIPQILFLALMTSSETSALRKAAVKTANVNPFLMQQKTVDAVYLGD